MDAPRLSRQLPHDFLVFKLRKNTLMIFFSSHLLDSSIFRLEVICNYNVNFQVPQYWKCIIVSKDKEEFKQSSDRSMSIQEGI